MKRIALLALVSLITVTGSAWAQVATPTLAPGMPLLHSLAYPGVNSAGYTPTNPAAMPWSMNSHAGLGALTGQQEDSLSPTANDAEGKFGGLRWVGERFAIGLETADFDTKSAIISSQELSSVAIAAKTWDWLTLGVSRETFGFTLGTLDRKVEGIAYGASFRIGEWIYVGAGMASQDFQDSPSIGPTSQGSRDGTTAGLALMGGKDFRWRIEGSVVDMDDFVTDASTVVGGGFKQTEGQLEVIFGSILVGATSYSSTVPTPGSTVELSGSSYSLGYVPMSGLSVVVRHEDGQRKSATQTLDDSIDSATVAWIW